MLLIPTVDLTKKSTDSDSDSYNFDFVNEISSTSPRITENISSDSPLKSQLVVESDKNHERSKKKRKLCASSNYNITTQSFLNTSEQSIIVGEVPAISRSVTSSEIPIIILSSDDDTSESSSTLKMLPLKPLPFLHRANNNLQDNLKAVQLRHSNLLKKIYHEEQSLLRTNKTICDTKSMLERKLAKRELVIQEKSKKFQLYQQLDPKQLNSSNQYLLENLKNEIKSITLSNCTTRQKLNKQLNKEHDIQLDLSNFTTEKIKKIKNSQLELINATNPYLTKNIISKKIDLLNQKSDMYKKFKNGEVSLEIYKSNKDSIEKSLRKLLVLSISSKLDDQKVKDVSEHNKFIKTCKNVLESLSISKRSNENKIRITEFFLKIQNYESKLFVGQQVSNECLLTATSALQSLFNQGINDQSIYDRMESLGINFKAYNNFLNKSGDNTFIFLQTIQKVRDLLLQTDRSEENKQFIYNLLFQLENYKLMLDSGIHPETDLKSSVANALRQLAQQGIKMPMVFKILEEVGVDWTYSPENILKNIDEIRSLISDKLNFQSKQIAFKLLNTIEKIINNYQCNIQLNDTDKNDLRMAISGLKAHSIKIPLLENAVESIIKRISSVSFQKRIDDSRKKYFDEIIHTQEIFSSLESQDKLKPNINNILSSLNLFQQFRSFFEYTQPPLNIKEKIQKGIDCVRINNIELPTVFKYLGDRGFIINKNKNLISDKQIISSSLDMMNILQNKQPEYDTIQMSNIYRSEDTESLRNLLEGLKQLETEVDGEELTPQDLTINLLKYQRQGLHWLLNIEKSNKKGGLLADDMGLGKTVQSIALMLANRSEENHCKINLIVAPVAVLSIWNNEIQTKVKKCANFNVLIYGSSRGFKVTSFADLKKYDVVLVSYQTLGNEFKKHWPVTLQNIKGRSNQFNNIHNMKVLNGFKSKSEYWSPFYTNDSIFYRIILDEAQNIKNKNTQSSKACCAINSTYRWALSGTPIQNNIQELYSLIRFLNIPPYNREDLFQKDIGRVLNSKGDNNSLDKENAIKKVQVLLRAIMLRRTKNSKINGKSILELPPKHIHTNQNELSGHDAKFYSNLEQDAAKLAKKLMNESKIGSYSNILTLLLRLRQACCHPELVILSEAKSKASKIVDAIDFNKWKEMFFISQKMDHESINNVTNSLKHLVCAKCMEQMEIDSISVLTCGHLLCNSCVESFINDAKCVVHSEIGLNNNLGTIISCIVCSKPINDQEILTYKLYDKVINQGINLTELRNEFDSEIRDKKCQIRNKYQLDYEKLKPSAKVSQCLKIIRTILDSSAHEKILIFSQFISFFDILQYFIKKDLKLLTLRYDGSMTSIQRSDIIEKFYKQDEQRLMLISMKAGNAGLTLTCANHVILVDPFWNPFVEEQAMDRCYRISQEKEVHIYRLLIKNSVEDRIVELQNRKKELVESAMDPTKIRGINRLGRQELGFLFGLNQLNI